MVPIYQDEWIIALNKPPGMPVQPDTSGDPSLLDEAERIAEGPLHPLHRIDRPAGGVVVFAMEAKTAGVLGEAFRKGRVKRVYWAVTDNPPPEDEGRLEHYIVTDKGRNISKAYPAEELSETLGNPETQGKTREPGKQNSKKTSKLKKAKRSLLIYRLIGRSDRYVLLEIELLTGRHHQIRAQLRRIGCHIKGDLKYGAKRSNPGGGIHLHARSLSFPHPHTGEKITIFASVPASDPLWELFPRERN